MSWGVATQNGVSVSLASIVSLSCGATEAFSPASLFTSGVAGAWYDPSDINNYMAGLGPELVTNGSFSSSSNWLTTGNSSVSGGTGNLDGTAVAGLLYQAGIFSNGKCYQVEFDVVSITGTLKCWNNDGTTIYSTTTSGRKSFTYIHAIASSNFLFRADLGGNIASVDNVSVREVTTIANATLFQDSAGTTPVTAVEQPVGLMLDKSQGLVLGTDVVVNGDFATDTNWTKGAGWTISGGSANLVAGGYPIISQNFSYTLGAWYQVTFTVTNRVSAIVQFLTSPGRQKGPQTSANGTYTFLFLASAGDTYIGIQDQNGVGSLSIDNLIVKQLSGNHASQATAASRPVLRARYNLLTYSEQLDNAAWTVTNASRSVGVTDPNGGTTAATITATAANGYIRYAFSAGALSATNSIWIRRRTGTGVVYLNTPDNATAVAVSVTSSWQRFQVSSTGTIISLIVLIQTSGDAIDIAFPQMNWGSSASTYQRIAAATDYATAGFLPYLALDGTDDSFGTNSIDFSATDKMFVCTGLTKLSDAVAGIVAELSANWNSNTGSFIFTAPSANAPTNDIAFASRGNAPVNINQQALTVVAAPTTKVISALNDIAASTTVLRSNGADVNTATGSKGTGNFGNYPLYIGRRANTSIPFNGRIYQLVVCGKTLSASELSATEAYVNSKTGAY